MTDGQTDRRTDICDCRVASATENIFYFIKEGQIPIQTWQEGGYRRMDLCLLLGNASHNISINYLMYVPLCLFGRTIFLVVQPLP